MPQVDIKSLTYQDLQAYVASLGEKPYRAAQIFDWLHVRRVTSFDAMTNLSKALRQRLAQECVLTTLAMETVQVSKLDGTRKYLFALGDGNLIESVFMPYHHGNSVCISSQAGCRMACAFCASGLDGLARNLTAAEMLDQVYRIMEQVAEPVNHVVVMGTGEPLDNYDNLIRFIRLINEERGMHLSQRNITVSSCGLVPQMRALADEDLAITLALSLHAPNQAKRLTLMPIAQAYSIDEVMEACRYYFAKTRRRITFEYSLIRGINDSAADAEELAHLAAEIGAHINLIPVNPIKERNFRQTDAKNVQIFKNKLEKNTINVTIRREMGRDIDGACGQLRKRYADDAIERTKD